MLQVTYKLLRVSATSSRRQAGKYQQMKASAARTSDASRPHLHN